MKKFIEELRRRNVIKASLAYLVIAWVLLQVFEFLLPMLGAPEWLLPTFTLILAIGLPVWIIISWIYDITPEGIEKTAKVSENELVSQVTNKRLNIFIIVSLSIAVIVMGLKLSNIFAPDSDGQFTIAILPFDNLNSDKDKEWYSDAVTSDIHIYLSHVNNFHVISLQSVERYRETDKTTPEIAEELGVSYVVGGSMRQIKNRIVITAHLTEASSDKQLWAENYDEILDENALKIQQDVSKKIVQELKKNISPDDEEVLNILPTKNQEAYELFKKGKAKADKRSSENRVIPESIELFKKAIALDSNYADAYAEMALLKYISRSDPEEIEYLNNKALEINPKTARVYSTRGLIYTNNRNFEEAENNFEKALEINPNDATTLQHFALYYGRLPIIDHENRLIQIRKAQKINPYSNPINNAFLYALLDNGRVLEAEEFLKKVNYVYPDYALSQIAKEEFKGLIKSHKEKDFTEIIKNMHKAIEATPDNMMLTWHLGNMYNNVLNDDANYLKYCRIAHESDSKNLRFSFYYYYSLLDNKKFEEANKLFKNYATARSSYYYATDSLEKALDYINRTNNEFTIEIKLDILAKMGERDSIKTIFENNPVHDHQKAIVYALLKEKDSMYHYLNKCVIRVALNDINGNNAFNPYRKEERYKAFLKKNYLPITEWN
jgi:TolB-like protein/Tfp pilus assembly protein PilF